MKSGRSLRWIPAVLFLCLLGSCDSSVSPEAGDGVFVGRWAGRLWVGDAAAHVAHTAEGLVLTIFASRPQGGIYAREMLSARVVYTGPGFYLLDPDDVVFSEITGGDVISAEYHGSGTPAGTLRITRFDESAGVVAGELSFRTTTQSEYGSYGRTARLESGAFRAITPMMQLESP